MLLKLLAFLMEKISGHIVVDYAGIKVAVGPNALLDRYILQGRNLNPYLTSALSQYLYDGGIFLDIGAHHGIFSLMAAQNPKTMVYAFEPSARELKRLQTNLALNDLNNIHVFTCGLGEKNETRMLRLSGSENPGMNSLPEIRKTGRLMPCQFYQLTTLLNKERLSQARVCKLDIEGQEMRVLNSLKHHMTFLKRCVFVIEMSPIFLNRVGASVNDIYDFFATAGFTYQFGQPAQAIQWEECFYHPAYQDKLQLDNSLELSCTA